MRETLIEFCRILSYVAIVVLGYFAYVAKTQPRILKINMTDSKYQDNAFGGFLIGVAIYVVIAIGLTGRFLKKKKEEEDPQPFKPANEYKPIQQEDQKARKQQGGDNMFE